MREDEARRPWSEGFDAGRDVSPGLASVARPSAWECPIVEAPRVSPRLIESMQGVPEGMGGKVGSERLVVGFTAGVYDLFHVGHLNLLEGCRERCDFLMVGVISDEICAVLKRRTPVICLEQRLRIIAGLRCVDLVVPIREERLLSKVEAWYDWRFDVTFSGDDHRTDPFWQREERTLRELGARIEYLPYTSAVSSSAIRGRMREDG